MKTIELDTEKILSILKRRDRTISWLAREMEIFPQSLHRTFKNRSLDQVSEIAAALGIKDPKTLIITVEVEEKCSQRGCEPKAEVEKLPQPPPLSLKRKSHSQKNSPARTKFGR